MEGAGRKYSGVEWGGREGVRGQVCDHPRNHHNHHPCKQDAEHITRGTEQAATDTLGRVGRLPSG